MPLTLDEVHDLIDSWELDPSVQTLEPASQLLATMAVGDPGRVDVLLVMADHQARRADVEAALATLDLAAGDPNADTDVLSGYRAAYLIGAQRDDEAEPLLLELRRRGTGLMTEAREVVAEALEETGRFHEAMRWFTMGLRDLDPQHDLPDPDEEEALIGRWRVRRALELPPDHYDLLAQQTLDLRRAGRGDRDSSRR